MSQHPPNSFALSTPGVAVPEWHYTYQIPDIPHPEYLKREWNSVTAVLSDPDDYQTISDSNEDSPLFILMRDIAAAMKEAQRNVLEIAIARHMWTVDVRQTVHEAVSSQSTLFWSVQLTRVYLLDENQDFVQVQEYLHRPVTEEPPAVSLHIPFDHINEEGELDTPFPTIFPDPPNCEVTMICIKEPHHGQQSLCLYSGTWADYRERVTRYLTRFSTLMSVHLSPTLFRDDNNPRMRLGRSFDTMESRVRSTNPELRLFTEILRRRD
ncbi:hypothetical protein D9613_000117 [Agrocybe pediades]|uniref:Uncharacterized protein n=1 Tax=Agrocybe pediades TaxID=84607 RepID=A0A8H4QZ91_9AGAR|nr:hypothetical protein D9613_000117 [Agrocybe pediades]